MHGCAPSWVIFRATSYCVDDRLQVPDDRAILVNVLGLPESLVAPGGPIDLLRHKLAREPQIHGGKQSRVVFTDEGEKSVRRHDR